ncbi:MAG TPA: polysaccharide deacetylase family protein [Methylibium sp.]|uniref:polysaccharide deacetylase family protein n=1 Tax=Methylibium sp. TaxID=2067992 RepID=UPI002DB717F7|nr:polysaccharide deacetylase family protein [Methylibium sp.]HEU4459108.1 polysaccharide deacetylase family protein [Methylibium sp.]
MNDPAPPRLIDDPALPPVMAVVIHDVAPPTWADCQRIERLLHDIDPGLRKTWLVVPRYHDHALGPRMIGALDRALALGDELALHGWRHLDDGTPHGAIDRWKRRRYTAGEGEFAALDATEAAHRIAAGRAWFERRGWPLHGFVPPAWLINAASLAEVERAGFRYACTLARVHTWRPRRAFDEGPRPQRSLASQSVVYSTRSAWRRALSCAWNAGVAWQQRDRWLSRIELHPGDVRHQSVRRAWIRLVERQREHREPVTMAEVAARIAGWNAASPYSRQAAVPATNAAPLPALPVVAREC